MRARFAECIPEKIGIFSGLRIFSENKCYKDMYSLLFISGPNYWSIQKRFYTANKGKKDHSNSAKYNIFFLINSIIYSYIENIQILHFMISIL